MVNISFRDLRPVHVGIIGALVFLAIYLLCVINAFVKNDAEPQLVLAFFGFPSSWILITVFHPLLEWLGPFGSTTRRIGEWSLLFLAGIVQYWSIGYLVAYLVGKYARDNDQMTR